MDVTVGDRVLSLIRGDITRIEVDAVVNAANEGLIPGGGLDGAIHRAGGPSIERETRSLTGSPKCPTGQAVVTGAGNLPARHVIHAVAPVWRGGSHGEAGLLAAAYRSSLDVAAGLDLRSIAFPSLGTGIYGYPIEQASRIALSETVRHLQGDTPIEHVTFVLFSEPDLRVYEHALKELLSPQSQ